MYNTGTFMKITRSQLKQLIKEEIFLFENTSDNIDNDGDGVIDEPGEGSENELTARLASLRGQNLYKRSFQKRYKFYVKNFTPSDSSLDYALVGIRNKIRDSVQNIEDAKSNIAATDVTLLTHVIALAIAEAHYAFWSPLLDLVKSTASLEATTNKMKEIGWSEALDDEFIRKLTKLANLSATVQK